MPPLDVSPPTPSQQAFAAGGDNGNESFESRFLCTGTRLCYTTDLWRTDIHVLVSSVNYREQRSECDMWRETFKRRIFLIG